MAYIGVRVPNRHDRPRSREASQRESIMAKQGLWEITTGETFFVRANSEDEALAKFYVSQGHEDEEAYPDFDFENLDDDVEEGETNTIALPVAE